MSAILRSKSEKSGGQVSDFLSFFNCHVNIRKINIKASKCIPCVLLICSGTYCTMNFQRLRIIALDYMFASLCLICSSYSYRFSC